MVLPVKEERVSGTDVGEALSAAHVLTLVRLLARVCSDMHCEGASLDEALSAAGGVARIWALIGVYPVMPLQVRLAVEALAA
jgi:hypothetical protein